MSDVNLQNLLNALTDAVLSGDESAADRLAVDTPQGIFRLIHALHTTLQPQQPSDQFMRSLKKDLIGQNHTMISRVRSLPGRVQMATGVAAFLAGVMWILRRRGDLPAEGDVELPALQQSQP